MSKPAPKDNSAKRARTEANKARRIMRHMVKNPKDKTLAGMVPDYKRSEPRREVTRLVLASPVSEHRRVFRDRDGSVTVLKLPHFIRSQVFPLQILDVVPA